MSYGIRLRHSTLTNVMFTVPIPSIPFAAAQDKCPTCQVPHQVKTVHLWLDDVGSVIVSEGVLGTLNKAWPSELSIVNRVESPPAQTIRQNRNGHFEQTIKRARIEAWGV